VGNEQTSLSPLSLNNTTSPWRDALTDRPFMSVGAGAFVDSACQRSLKLRPGLGTRWPSCGAVGRAGRRKPSIDSGTRYERGGTQRQGTPGAARHGRGAAGGKGGRLGTARRYTHAFMGCRAHYIAQNFRNVHWKFYNCIFCHDMFRCGVNGPLVIFVTRHFTFKIRKGGKKKENAFNNLVVKLRFRWENSQFRG